MIQQRRVMSIPPVFSVRYRAPAAVASVPWYRAGAPPAPIAIYQPKGAASLAASYVNLVNPGTYDLALSGSTLGWNATDGWVFPLSRNNYLSAAIPFVAGTWSALIRFSGAVYGTLFSPAGGTTYITPLANFDQVVEWALWNTYKVNAPAMTSGTLGFAGNSTYRNGNIETGTLAGTGTHTNVRLGTYNGGTFWGYEGNIQAVAIWDTSTNHATWMPAVSAAAALI